jgi:hypothetical protein
MIDLGFGILDFGSCRAAQVAGLMLFLLAGGGVNMAIGQESDESVELGREAFSKRNYPWYDASKDAPRPLRVGEKSETKASAQKLPSKGPRRTNGGSGGFSLFGSALQVAGLVLLTLILAAVAALIVWAFLRNESTQTPGASIVSASRDVDRVEQLPFALKRASGDFLAEARRLAEAGNHSEAIIYLYSHLLVQLDKHHVIRLAKGKTNRQYLRETRARPVLAGILETTMVAFEDVFFGCHQLEKERFEECHSQIAQLERVAA